MVSPASRSEQLPQAAAQQSLYVLFRIGADRYALAAREVVEVVGLRPLKQLPGAPAWVAGVLAYREQTIPVIDLAARMGAESALHRTSTRLIVVHYERHDTVQPAAMLGLILQEATNTLRSRPSDFVSYGLDNRDSPWLGPVLETAQGLIQRISVQSLIPADVHALLFPLESPA